MKQHPYKDKPTMLLAVALITVGGVIFTLLSQAATSSVTIEVENGVLESPAGIASDSTASNGQSLQFHAAQPLGGPGGNWRMIFNDEFNGTALDMSKWNQCVNAGWNIQTAKNAGNYPVPCVGFAGVLEKTYLPQNVSVSGGAVRLKAVKNSDGSVTSGAINTSENVFGNGYSNNQPFSYKYGYLEVRMKAPISAGMWPAVWKMPAEGSGGHDEMDLMESIGGFPQSTLHGPISQGNPNWGHVSAYIPDLATTYHTFAEYWAPGVWQLYYDGKLMAYDSPVVQVPAVPEFIQANMQISGPGSPFAGVVPASQQWPVEQTIDYVRVWQR